MRSYPRQFLSDPLIYRSYAARFAVNSAPEGGGRWREACIERQRGVDRGEIETDIDSKKGRNRERYRETETQRGREAVSEGKTEKLSG